MSSDMTWRIHVKNLVTDVRIGIHAHEREPQRVLVNVVIEGVYAVRPQSIVDCISYDAVHELVVGEWPKRAHTGLLETYVVELLEHIFRSDARVAYVQASLTKPDIFAAAEAVGVEAAWTRADFERLGAKS